MTFRWIVFALLPAVILSFILATALKMVFQISRPCIESEICVEGYSFPSRHASVLFAFATVIFLHTISFKIKNTWKKILSYNIAMMPYTIALLISAERMVAIYHTFPDIIAGMLLGIWIGYLVDFLQARLLK